MTEETKKGKEKQKIKKECVTGRRNEDRMKMRKNKNKKVTNRNKLRKKKSKYGSFVFNTQTLTEVIPESAN